ncbi:MAG TPA: enoyl-CoA hydratase-related protein [Candidatus Acidoferrales bacterium]
MLESREGAVVTLTMNRPERLNALNIELTQALVAALQRVAADDSVRCVVLTGAGRAFCAGGDLELLRSARERQSPQELEGLMRGGSAAVLAIARMPKPVIGAINGPAAGGGMNLALACDFRIASDAASFGESFGKLGLYPDLGGTFFLPRLVGPSHAAELFWHADMISAAEAARIGVVNRVVPQGKFTDEVRATAARLAAAPPIAARAVKQLLFSGEVEALERALEREVETQVRCFLTEDCAEGLKAFSEKRPPVFRGR